MIFFEISEKLKQLGRWTILIIGALALAACAGTVDDSVNSRLTQPVGEGNQKPIESGDIAIAGQDFAHSIRELAQVANAPKPPLVQFMGVTSIVNGSVPVDTEPYTDLLRDRLVLGCREKLRFIERELPPLITAPPKKIKKNKDLPPPVLISTDPDYQVLAELHGNYDDNFYKIQIQFVDIHTNEVLFNALYRIRKEAPSQPSGTTTIDTQTIQAPPPSQSSDTGVPGSQ
jgi:hypothetical protein